MGYLRLAARMCLHTAAFSASASRRVTVPVPVASSALNKWVDTRPLPRDTGWLSHSPYPDRSRTLSSIQRDQLAFTHANTSTSGRHFSTSRVSADIEGATEERAREQNWPSSAFKDVLEQYRCACIYGV
eukprot:7266121-Pyramimonas_sp.AAC.2